MRTHTYKYVERNGKGLENGRVKKEEKNWMGQHLSIKNKKNSLFLLTSRVILFS